MDTKAAFAHTFFDGSRVAVVIDFSAADEISIRASEYPDTEGHRQEWMAFLCSVITPVVMQRATPAQFLSLATKGLAMLRSEIDAQASPETPQAGRP